MTDNNGDKPRGKSFDSDGAVQPKSGAPPSSWQLFGTTLSGCLVFLSFPEFNHHALLWFSLVPLLLVLERIRRRKHAFLLGWWTGFVTNLGGFYWIGGMLEDFGHLPPAVSWFLTILNAAYQGLVFALFAYLVVRLRTPGPFYRYVSVPLLMVFSETCVPFIFPWYFSNGILLATELTQIVELVGVEVTTAFIVFVNVALAAAVQSAWRTRRIPVRELLYATGVLGALFAFGTWRIHVIEEAMHEAPKLRVGMVEANVGIWEKNPAHSDRRSRELMLRANLMRHHLLSEQVTNEGAELVVWPETSYVPYYGVAVKRSPYFGLVRTQDNKILLRLSGDRFVPPSQVEGAEILAKVDGHIRAVVGPREDTALILSRGGRIFRLGEQGWQEELSGVAVNLNAGWISGGSRRLDSNIHARSVHCGQEGPECDLPAVAVGAGGVYLRRRNSRWNQAENPSSNDLNAVTGTIHDDTTSIYAAGNDGIIVLESGNIRTENFRLKVVHQGGPNLRAIAVSRRGRVAAVGDQCTLLISKSKEKFTEVKVPGCTEPLRAVGFLTDGRLIAGGRKGQLIYEESLGGALKLRDLGPDAYIRVIADDPFGRPSLTLGDGKVLDVSDPAVDELPLLTDVAQPVFRMAHLGYLRDIWVPDDATYLYASPLPYPMGPNLETRIRNDSRSPSFDRDAVQRSFEKHLIFGAISYQAEEVLVRGAPLRGNLQNTVIMLGPDGAVLGLSHKMRLLIFGEYIPFGDIFPFLYDWIPEAGNYVAGEDIQPLIMNTAEHGPIRIAPLICYEDILPAFSSRALALDPHFLVNVTNDAWFGKTHEPALHLQLSAARSIETRRTLVRSTNTGISAFVDPLGRIQDPTSLEDAEIRVRDIPLLTISTLYGFPARLLFWLSMAWVIILLLGEVVRAAPRRSRSRSGEGKPKSA